jgi:hypothetical protein
MSWTLPGVRWLAFSCGGDPGGHGEIDFYLERITSRNAQSIIERVSPSRMRAVLRLLATELGDRLIAGVVLGTSDRGLHYSKKLIGLPISALWSWAASPS